MPFVECFEFSFSVLGGIWTSSGEAAFRCTPDQSDSFPVVTLQDVVLTAAPMTHGDGVVALRGAQLKIERSHLRDFHIAIRAENSAGVELTASEITNSSLRATESASIRLDDSIITGGSVQGTDSEVTITRSQLLDQPTALLASNTTLTLEDVALKAGRPTLSLLE